MTIRPFKTGQSREQGSFLPPRIADYVGADNPVRAIDAYVGSLDLVALRFRHADHAEVAGQPPYDPADLLKLYLYGYTNQIRSSRRLAREAARNVELIWLLRGLTPGYRSIAKFRSANAAALKAANQDFVLLLRSLDLVGGELVAIDGAFFHGDASQASIVTRDRLAKQLAAVERDITDYAAALEANDAAEAAEPQAPPGGDVAGKLAALLARRAAAQADLAKLEASGATQLSRTDGDARLLSKTGQSVAGYNVQIAVDDKHKLIVASDVVNDGNDTGQLHAMALAAKQALDAATLKAVADTGYYNGATLKACEEAGIEAFVPEPNRGQPAAADGRFGLDAFAYDAEADTYRCPAGEQLRPMPGRKLDATGKLRIRYASRRSACRSCPLRQRCLSPKADRRVIERWEHEAVVERHRARMTRPDAQAAVRRRKALAEYPFGTLKCRAGYRHFLLRGFDKVRGEWSLMALCYNVTRLISILGLDALIRYLAERWPNSPLPLLAAVISAVGHIQRRGADIWTAAGPSAGKMSCTGRYGCTA